MYIPIPNTHGTGLFVISICFQPYIGLEPKFSHVIKYSQPLKLIPFHFIAIRIKCLKGSYLLNNYLINYSNFSGLTLTFEDRL